MGVLDWVTAPARNADVDPAVRAADGTSARDLPSALRGVMAASAALAADQGGALRSGGVGNSYVVNTASGIRTPRRGISILVEIDRANTDAVTLNVDGTGPRPWLDQSGAQFPVGSLQPSALVRATWSEARNGWVSDLIGGLTVAAFDVVMRLWWASLPTDPRGLGPAAPWRNGDIVAWTTTTNPGFTIDSPAGRRLALRLISEALPTSPDGLDPGDAWMNGGSIAFVPNA
ncbi:hypothetical protein [Methylobacterium aquaticum]|uniref:hypothetical protein n=1 Tax=Methylobacterium aquaticum TaxID=270351 RepID=UPI0019331FF4|nr:hypothetical protein [Methylobacterium aquaticum]QRE76477.1 hypothetical protein F1D61_25510 [Methylobacterium aquaticum]